jgi:hypothetical protein
MLREVPTKITLVGIILLIIKCIAKASILLPPT